MGLQPAVIAVAREIARPEYKRVDPRGEFPEDAWLCAWELHGEAGEFAIGADGLQVLRDRGLLGAPVYPHGDPAGRAGFLTHLLARHMRSGCPAPALTPPTLAIKPKRNSLLTELFASGYFRADWLSYHLGDKLVAGKVIELCLGADAPLFAPPVAGVKEFLARENLVDANGEWISSPDALRSALRRRFPRGYVLKAAMAYGSKDGSFYHDEEKILAALRNGPAYAPGEFSRPHQPGPEFADFAFSSGEKFFLMEKVAGTALAGDCEAGRSAEIRAHSVEGKCLPDAVFARWDGAVDIDSIRPRVVAFVEEFLSRMPRGFRERQVYSYDLFVPAEGQIQILEINTNRGRVKSWSDYLRHPDVLAAHVRVLERDYGWKFSGAEGEAFRAGCANVTNYVRSDLVFLLLDEDEGAPRRDFWRTEIAKNAAIVRRALAFRAESDAFGYFADLRNFGERFLLVAEENDWPKLVAWARQDLADAEFLR